MDTTNQTLTPKEQEHFNDQIIRQILDNAHPLLAEAIKLAAIPQWFTGQMLAHLRRRDDGRDPKLTLRLAKFVFINPIDSGYLDRYTVEPSMREALLRIWADDPEAFKQAQQRALTYLQALESEIQSADSPESQTAINAQGLPDLVEQSQLYHQFLSQPDGSAAVQALRRRFSRALDQYRLASAERLLEMVQGIRQLPPALQPSWIELLDQWQVDLQAWLALRRQQWLHCQELNQQLLERSDLLPEIQPYALRNLGRALVAQEKWVEGIEHQEQALALFEAAGDQFQIAKTMLQLGQAYLEGAIQTRGGREAAAPHRVELSFGRTVRFITSLIAAPSWVPILTYLSLQLSPRAILPAARRIGQGQDWMIARLFATSGRWFRQAQSVLEQLKEKEEINFTDSRLAELYLALGSYRQAARLYTQVLACQGTDALNEYRTAIARTGLAHAQLRLKQAQKAIDNLQETLPVLESYDDRRSLAAAHGLMAEALYATDRISEAWPHFRQALHLYQRLGDHTAYTDLAERLEQISYGSLDDEELKTEISSTSSAIVKRRYMAHYSHPAMRLFKTIRLLSLVLLLLFIPYAVISTSSSAIMEASAIIQSSPIATVSSDFAPSLQSSMEQTAKVGVDGDLALWAIAVVLLIHLLIDVLGFLVISKTPLRSVQQVEAQDLMLDAKGLSIGRPEDQDAENLQSIGWREITAVLVEDKSTYADHLWPNFSAFTLFAQGKQLSVPGHTAWYQSLQTRIRGYLEPSIPIIDRNFRIVHAGLEMGTLFWLAMAFIFTVVEMSVVQPSWITQTLIRPYTPADLLPYIYACMTLPLMWWTVVKPLQALAYRNPSSKSVWLVAALGLLALLLFFLGRGHTGAPNTIPGVAAIVLCAAAGLAVFGYRHWRTVPTLPGEHVYPSWLRWLALLLALAAVLGSGQQLVREGVQYHYQVRGNYALSIGDHLNAAEFYQQALNGNLTSTIALQGQAAVNVQQQNYEIAIDNFSAALELDDTDPVLYGSRAATYQNWAAQLADAEQDDRGRSEELSELAIKDYTRALELDPDNIDYLLQRGSVFHSLGQWQKAQVDFGRVLDLDPNNDSALAGLGWAAFQQGVQAYNVNDAQSLESEQHFEQALDQFSQAVKLDSQNANNYNGLGYAQYRLKDYDAAIESFNQAAVLDPENSSYPENSGRIRWLSLPANPCDDKQSDHSRQEELTYTAQVEDIITNFERVVALDPEDDYSFRTLGQLAYSLRNCQLADYSYTEQISRAIEYYIQAIELNPDQASYYNRRSRLYYTWANYIWDDLAQTEESETRFQLAIEDAQKAVALDAKSCQPLLDYLEEEHWKLYWLRGWYTYLDGDYAQSTSDSERAAELNPDYPIPYFNSGLAFLAWEKPDQSMDQYQAGIEVALSDAGENPAGDLEEAIGDLESLLLKEPDLENWGIRILEMLRSALKQVDD